MNIERRKLEIQGALEKTKIEGEIDIQKRKAELEGKTFELLNSGGGGISEDILL